MYIGNDGGCATAVTQVRGPSGERKGFTSGKLHHDASRTHKGRGLDMVQKVSNAVTGAGAGVASWGWLTATEITALIGCALALAGFTVTFIYSHRRDRREHKRDMREQEFHEARMRKIRSVLDED